MAPPWMRSMSMRWFFARTLGRAVVAEGVVIEGEIWVPLPGRIRLGRRVKLRGVCAPIELRAEPGASIELGDGVTLGDGCSIEATAAVRIGAGSTLGAFSRVLDNNFHELNGDRSRRPLSRPVIVEEDCVIGPRAILLPGAHLGRGCRVGPATVVSRRIPAGSDIAGAPPVLRRRS